MSTWIKRNGEWVKVAGHSIWKGTAAQLSSALEAGDLHDGTDIIVTDDYTDGMPHPDWSKAISVTFAQIKAGYTMPADGIFVFTLDPATPVDTYVYMNINDVEVARGFRWASTSAATYITGQVPVNKGDVAKTVNLATTANNQYNIHFIPWKTEA